MQSKLLVLSIGLIVNLAGCGAGNEAKLRSDLQSTGLAYHSFHDEKRKGPANWDELIDFAKKANLFPDGIARVRDAGYVVTWDVKFSEVKEGPANIVLAKPPGEGPKLMMDGSVQ
jgi:hypothetical protein